MKMEINFIMKAILSVKDESEEIDEEITIEDGALIPFEIMKVILPKIEDQILKEDIEEKIERLERLASAFGLSIS